MAVDNTPLRVDTHGTLRIALPGEIAVLEARVRAAITQVALEHLRHPRELGAIAEIRSNGRAARAAMVSPIVRPLLVTVHKVARTINSRRRHELFDLHAKGCVQLRIKRLQTDDVGGDNVGS